MNISNTSLFKIQSFINNKRDLTLNYYILFHNKQLMNLFSPIDHTTQDLKDRLACQNNKVCGLKEKLVTYDRDVAMKEDLKCQLHNLQKWIEDVDCKVKQSNNQMINIINNQKQKTKEAETQECKLRSENTRLNNLNDCFTEKINTLNRKEQTLIAEIEKLELCKINIQNELCAAEVNLTNSD